MAGLSREVIRWLQSLDLTWQVKNAKWDLSNGYLVAEIFSWYYPQAIQMHNYYPNGTSLKLKQLNWNLVELFIRKNDIDIPVELTDGTMHCKDGAAGLLIERMYEILTNREVKKKDENGVDFTDRAYQNKLPMHARTTASQAVKNNLKGTELDAQPSILHTQMKAHDIIRQHVEQRRVDRIQVPARFDIKPSLGERTVRKLPPQTTAYDESGDMRTHPVREVLHKSAASQAKRQSSTSNKRSNKVGECSDTEEVIREVDIKQMTTPTNMNVFPIHG